MHEKIELILMIY